VSKDGSVRELQSQERKFLETPFSPFDGGRPYTKDDYESKNGWGEIEGFCLRSKIPAGLLIGDAPDSEAGSWSKAEQIEFLRKKMSGFDLTEQSDGTVVAKRITKK
jgi:hypothetical protein